MVLIMERRPAMGEAVSTLTFQMNIQAVRQAKATEKAAKDAFYALHLTVKAGDPIPAGYVKLQGAMIAATKARNAAMTAYAASL
jgi:hypothetical protein